MSILALGKADYVGKGGNSIQYLLTGTAEYCKIAQLNSTGCTLIVYSVRDLDQRR